MDWNDKLVDMSEKKFNKLKITEVVYGENDYEYTCNYDIDVKYHNVKTDDPTVNKYANEVPLHDQGYLTKQFQSRPMDKLKLMGVTEEDVKYDTVDGALEDFLNHSKINTQLQVIWELFTVNLPHKILEKAYTSGSFQLSKTNKVKDVEFDYRKISIDKVTIIYEDDSAITVQLKEPVTNRSVSAIVPDMTLPEIYSKVSDWLQEDYDSTIELLNGIFKFNLETLKGAKVL